MQPVRPRRFACRALADEAAFQAIRAGVSIWLRVRIASIRQASVRRTIEFLPLHRSNFPDTILYPNPHNDVPGIGSASGAHVNVVVAALTFQRSDALEELLEGLAALVIPEHCTVTFLIVDNDVDETARAIVEKWRFRIPGIAYAVEPRLGIPVARNHALDHARGQRADVLCFIDDDESPDRLWLIELVDCWRATGAELIGGPVRIAAPPPAVTSWQKFINTSLAARARAKEHDAARDARRGRCRTIVTNNFLCDLAFTARNNLRFDESLLVTGGSDTEFFRRAMATGCRAAWCPTAIVHERISGDRLSLRYQFHRGLNQSLTHFHLKHRQVTATLAVTTVVTAAVRAVLGLALLAVPIYGLRSLVTAVRSLGWAAGRLAALRGARSTLYAQAAPEVSIRDGEETGGEATGRMRNFRTVARLFRETVGTCRMEYGLAVVAMAFVAVSTAGMAGLMRLAINDVFVHRDLRTMWLVAGGIVVLSVLKGVADYTQGVVMTRISNRVTATFQRRLFDRLLRSRLKVFASFHSSTLITRITTKAQAASRLLGLVTSSLARDLAMLVSLLVVMLYQDPLLSMVALLTAPIIVMGTQAIVQRLRTVADMSGHGAAGVIAVIQETCHGIRAVKAFTLEDEMRSRLHCAVAEVETRSNAVARVGRLTSPLMESLGGIVIATMVVYSGWQTVVHGKTPGEFMAFVAAFLLAYEPAKRLANVQVTLAPAVESVGRMYGFLDKSSGEPLGLPAIPARVAHGHVVVSGVSFGYADSAVLDEVSFECRPGEITALVGPSGAGKSTLFGLLQRFYDPWRGTITIDGHDTSAFDPHSIRRLLAVVSQDVTLFRGSVADNIRLGSPAATMHEVEAAARAAAAFDFITAMPAGFSTLVGERHATLSGGQAQRVAIARAVLKNAPILLLDEATSALDAGTERSVQRALEALMKGRTTIVIAHRLSTIERADRIYLLDAGRIVGCGRHEELLASHPLYRRLFTAPRPGVLSRAA